MVRPVPPPEAADDYAHKLKMIVLLVLAVVLLFACLLFLPLLELPGAARSTIDIVLQSTGQADYSAEKRSLLLPEISLDIIAAVIGDESSEGDRLVRLATLTAWLSTPVPTMTPRPTRLVIAPGRPTAHPPRSTPADTAGSPTHTPGLTPSASFSPTPAASATAEIAGTTVYEPTQAAATSQPSRTPQHSTVTATVAKTITRTPAPTPTNTSTNTPTLTPTNTPTPTSTNTPTPTSTPTPTNTPTPTSTNTSTPTSTPTPTNTPTPTPANTPTATSGSPPGMHVGDLNGSSTLLVDRWIAYVTVHVHDQSENPLSGVEVSGSWTEMGSGTGSSKSECTTNAAGSCQVFTDELQFSISSTSFTIKNNGLKLTGYQYIDSDNHDPDGCETSACNSLTVPLPLAPPVQRRAGQTPSITGGPYHPALPASPAPPTSHATPTAPPALPYTPSATPPAGPAPSQTGKAAGSCTPTPGPLPSASQTAAPKAARTPAPLPKPTAPSLAPIAPSSTPAASASPVGGATQVINPQPGLPAKTFCCRMIRRLAAITSRLAAGRRELTFLPGLPGRAPP